MKFKINQVAAAVAVSLGTAVAGMNAAQADVVFFPNLAVSKTVSSILSVINDDEAPGVTALHYRYYYKPAGNAGACEEVNYDQPTSPNDIVTFDIGGHFGDAKGVLFEPAPAKAKYDKDFAVFRNVKPVRAFGLVDNIGRGGNTFFPGQGIEGEAYLIEYALGSVWGYTGYNAADIVGWRNGQVEASAPFDFSDRVEVNGEVLVDPTRNGNAPTPDNYWASIAIMPWAGNIQTALFVTPVSTDMRGGAYHSAVTLAVNDPRASGLDVMYDRDENPFSGRRIVDVVCVNRVDVQDLITTAAQQFVQDSGGWSNVIVLRDDDVDYSTGQAVVMKLEYNDTAPAELDGVATGAGSWNNGFWLRKGFRESLSRRTYPVTGPARWMPVFTVTQDQEINSPYPLVDVAAARAAGLEWPPAYNDDPLRYLPYASSAQ